MKKTFLAISFAFLAGTFSVNCGGESGPEGFCNSLVDHILSVCDVNDPADQAMLQAFLTAMGQETTVEDLAADGGAAAKEECTVAFDNENFNQEAADAGIEALEATTTCEEALTAAGALGG